MKASFDVLGFYAALDSQRRARRLNWKAIAAETKVSASTLSRMSQGKRPGVDALASLLAWSGLDITDFICRDDAPPAISAGPSSVWQGTFLLFGTELKCHVLSDGQRIIEEDSMVDLLKAMESSPENSCDDAEMVSFVKWLSAQKTPA